MVRVEPIGSKIAELRKARGIKQLDLAVRVGLGESTLRKVETEVAREI
jgi:transcriptional regulator with XRE-family HTH domain